MLLLEKNVSIELNEKYISFIYKYIEINKFSNFIAKVLKIRKLLIICLNIRI